MLFASRVLRIKKVSELCPYIPSAVNMGFLALFLAMIRFFLSSILFGTMYFSSSNHCPYSVTCFAFLVSISCPCLFLKLSYNLTPLKYQTFLFSRVTFLSSTPLLGWHKVSLTPSSIARRPSCLKQI